MLEEPPVLDSLLSDHWYRVAELRPRLRPHLRRYQHRYRGREWTVLEDAAAGRRHRLDRAGALLVACFDGRASLQQAWASVAGELGDEAPAQDDVIRLLAALHAADLMQCELQSVAADLARNAERTEGLVLRAPSAGVVWLTRAQDLPGSHVAHGASLGWLLRDEPAVARVVVDQRHVGLVRERTQSVQIRLASNLAATMEGIVLRQVPAAGTRLPSAALGSGAGGTFAVDPSAGDGTTTLEPVFQFDVALPIRALRNFAGARLLARFDHGTEPLWRQWLRHARQVFLARLAL